MRIPNPAQSREAKNERMSLINRIMIGYIAVFGILLIAIPVFEHFGLHLIWTDAPLNGGILMLASLLIWAGINIFRRIKKRIARIMFAFIGGFALMVLTMSVMVYISQYSQLFKFHEYTKIQAAGHNVVVMRAVDTGIDVTRAMDEDYSNAEDWAKTEERMNARRDALIAEGVVVEGDTYPEGAYGYVYKAYPVKMSIFYDADAAGEGEIYMGFKSEAKMLYDATPESLRIYIEFPEIGDSGTITVGAVGAADRE